MARELVAYRNDKDAMVLGLPRGGVVTACEVAKSLDLPLDIVVPRKIGAPGNPEFAIGAIAEDGEPILEQAYVEMTCASEGYLQNVIGEERKEARRRLKLYRGRRPPLNLEDKTAILVDDGVATGATMRAAVESARAKGAEKVVVAVPVIAADTIPKLEKVADKVVYLDAPVDFGAVGRFFREFAQTTDEEVVKLLN